MSTLEQYLRGELQEGKTALPEILTPEILKTWRDAPTTIRIETTNRCNATCQFCAHPLMKRKQGNMTQKLFKKIINECVEISPKVIKPHLHGELFVDPKWKDRLSYIDKKLDSHIHIETNGSLVDEDASEFLTDLDNLRFIAFNFSAPSVEKCKDITSLDYYTVRDNIVGFIETCKAKKRYPDVHVIMVATPTYHTIADGAAFRRLWGPLSHTRMHYNYAGKLRPRGILHRTYCTGLSEMCILRDGKVGLCWMDIEGEEILGNANKETLMDIWNSDRVLDIRALHRQGKREQVPICNRCDFC